MLFHPMQIDERQRDTTRYVAAIWLGVTQLLLVRLPQDVEAVKDDADEQ